MDPRVIRSRTAVIAATLDLLAERGITATTIEAVAERSGVAKTTIYRQWDGQAALVLDAIGTTVRTPTDPGHRHPARRPARPSRRFGRCLEHQPCRGPHARAHRRGRTRPRLRRAAPPRSRSNATRSYTPPSPGASTAAN